MSRSEATLVEIFELQLRDAEPSPHVPVDAAARFLGSALMGLVTWWLAEGTPQEPETIDQAFRELAADGTRAALGVAL